MWFLPLPWRERAGVRGRGLGAEADGALGFSAAIRVESPLVCPADNGLGWQ